MAWTPEGPAKSKPLTGLTGQSNIEPHPLTDFIEVFDEDGNQSIGDWLHMRKVNSFEAIAPHPYFPIPDDNTEAP